MNLSSLTPLHLAIKHFPDSKLSDFCLKLLYTKFRFKYLGDNENVEAIESFLRDHNLNRRDVIFQFKSISHDRATGQKFYVFDMEVSPEVMEIIISRVHPGNVYTNEVQGIVRKFFYFRSRTRISCEFNNST